jgi:8-oxo-dGTP pyrophosphatase MutT (NUDIX family)
MKESLFEAPKFKVWQQNLLKNGLNVHGFQEIYTKFRHNGEILFSLVSVDASLPEGGKIPPICFIRGASVSVVVAFIDKDTKEKYLLLVKQRRVADGSYMYETPAGMMDTEVAPLTVAVKEVEEETGLTVTREQVIPLTDGRLYCSPGACDESMYMFYCELELSKSEIFAFHQKSAGVASEYENIETSVVSIPEAMKMITNTNGLLNIYLYLSAIGSFSPIV